MNSAKPKDISRIVRVDSMRGPTGDSLLTVRSRDGSINFTVSLGPLEARLRGRKYAYFKCANGPGGWEIGDESNEAAWEKSS